MGVDAQERDKEKGVSECEKRMLEFKNCVHGRELSVCACVCECACVHVREESVRERKNPKDKKKLSFALI